MENFVVSARKYRPGTFDSVIGQEHITHTLKNAIKNNHLAHAFLFCGPRGVGKTTCARILAKTINCLNITPDFEACNECDSCKAFNGNASFNIYELDAASNNSVEDIRGLVDQVRYAPQGAKYKIYIIDEVHMLSSAAFNAFLKTLEEPPSYAKFILATTERHKILPTILSRCQVFDFHRITIENAVMQLRKICASEGITAEDEALHVIAQKADGAMRDALSIFDRIVSFSGKTITYKDVILNLNILDYDYYFRAVDLMLAANLPDMLVLYDEVLTNGFDAQHFLSGFSDHLRNLMMCKHPNTVKLLEVAQTVAQKFMQQSQQCSQSLLLNALNLLNKCELEYKAARNQRLHVELNLMKLCHIQSVLDAGTLKKKITDHRLSAVPDSPAREETAPRQTEHVAETAAASKPAEPPAAEVPATTASPAAPSKTNVPPPLFKNGVNPLDRLKQQIAEKKKEEAQRQPEPEKKEEIQAPRESSPVSKEVFATAWDLYLKELQAENKMSLAVVFKHAQWQVKNDTVVELVLASQHEKELLEEERISMIPFMRRNLKNASFDLDVKVNSTIARHRVFTAEEKFNAMAEQNPLLNELRTLLALDLEY